jgi:hypothetical protein
MKRIKRITLILLLIGFAAGTATLSGCGSSKVCQAKKVGNHR